MLPKKVLLCTRWPVGGIRTYLRYVFRSFPAADYRFVLVLPDVPEARILVEDLDEIVSEGRLLRELIKEFVSRSIRYVAK